VELGTLLEGLSSKTSAEFKTMPEVVEAGDSVDVATLPIEARRWTRISDVVAVVADLKSSTQLGTGSKAASTASIYEAGTGGVVKIFDSFSADFLQIQGDGAFALFWGDMRFERAAAAGITIKTFSVDFTEKIEAKWPTKPETGFKVGIASHRVLVKRVGTPRNPAQQEPVWAGKPVNYAAKAAQSADRHELVVTGSVWDQFEKNDYLAFTCSCGDGPSDTLWKDFAIPRLETDETEAQGRKLLSAWCDIHGEEFCNAILDGKKRRDDVDDLRQDRVRSQMANALWFKARQERQSRNARRIGLSK
jgi:class 3 adenylate cyclase